MATFMLITWRTPLRSMPKRQNLSQESIDWAHGFIIDAMTLLGRLDPASAEEANEVVGEDSARLSCVTHLVSP